MTATVHKQKIGNGSKPTFIKSTNIFNCTDGTQISSTLVLDDIKHCTNGEDEFQCDMYFPEEMCSYEALDVLKMHSEINNVYREPRMPNTTPNITP